MNNVTKKREGILRKSAVQTIIASLLCIVIGIIIGYIVLLIINPSGAAGAIAAILKNYLYYPSKAAGISLLRSLKMQQLRSNRLQLIQRLRLTLLQQQ